MSRIDKIREMLQEEPQDIMLRYMLAMELKGAEDYQECLEIFSALMKEEPPYVPAFFMAGQSLAAIDRNEEAKVVITEGITHARQQGEMHAAGEMTDFLASLQ